MPKRLYDWDEIFLRIAQGERVTKLSNEYGFSKSAYNTRRQDPEYQNARRIGKANRWFKFETLILGGATIYSAAKKCNIIYDTAYAHVQEMKKKEREAKK